MKKTARKKKSIKTTQPRRRARKPIHTIQIAHTRNLILLSVATLLGTSLCFSIFFRATAVPTQPDALEVVETMRITSIPQFTPTPENKTPQPRWVAHPTQGKTFKRLSFSGSKHIYGIDARHNVHKGPYVWEKIPGLFKFKNISIDNDDSLWGVNSSNKIYKCDGKTNSWCKMDGKLTQLAAGKQIWGIDARGKIYQRVQNSWKRIVGSFDQVSVGYDGTVWAVSNGTTWEWSPSQEKWHVKSSWNKAVDSIAQIAVANKHLVWGIDNQGKTYRWKGYKWEQMTNKKMAQITIGRDDSVWGIDKHGNVFQYTEE